MLSKFEVRNYRNFKETLTIDFQKVGGYQYNSDCITNGLVSKMLIYGRNATGKTNLGKAILDIKRILVGQSFLFDEDITNADSDEKCSHFSYSFCFGNDTIVYEYAKHSANKLCREKLVINNSNIFSFDHDTKKYAVPNLETIQADTINLARYFDAIKEANDEQTEMTIPFLRWIVNNTAMQQESPLLKLAEYVYGMFTMGTELGIATNNAFSRSRKTRESFVRILEDPSQLDDFQGFLNAMGVQCKLKVERLPDGSPDLFFDYSKPLSFFEHASSGTLTLVQTYRIFQARRKPTFLYIDEFDAFYHFEMADTMLRYFKKYYDSSQIIITTHNTNLMTNRLMRPDCLCILSTLGSLTPLNEATTRELREGHNLEKMYISGEFASYE